MLTDPPLASFYMLCTLVEEVKEHNYVSKSQAYLQRPNFEQKPNTHFTVKKAAARRTIFRDLLTPSSQLRTGAVPSKLGASGALNRSNTGSVLGTSGNLSRGLGSSSGAVGGTSRPSSILGQSRGLGTSRFEGRKSYYTSAPADSNDLLIVDDVVQAASRKQEEETAKKRKAEEKTAKAVKKAEKEAVKERKAEEVIVAHLGKLSQSQDGSGAVKPPKKKAKTKENQPIAQTPLSATAPPSVIPLPTLQTTASGNASFSTPQLAQGKDAMMSKFADSLLAAASSETPLIPSNTLQHPTLTSSQPLFNTTTTTGSINKPRALTSVGAPAPLSSAPQTNQQPSLQHINAQSMQPTLSMPAFQQNHLQSQNLGSAPSPLTSNPSPMTLVPDTSRLQGLGELASQQGPIKPRPLMPTSNVPSMAPNFTNASLMASSSAPQASMGLAGLASASSMAVPAFAPSYVPTAPNFPMNAYSMPVGQVPAGQMRPMVANYLPSGNIAPTGMRMPNMLPMQQMQQIPTMVPMPQMQGVPMGNAGLAGFAAANRIPSMAPSLAPNLQNRAAVPGNHQNAPPPSLTGTNPPQKKD